MPRAPSSSLSEQESGMALCGLCGKEVEVDEEQHVVGASLGTWGAPCNARTSSPLGPSPILNTRQLRLPQPSATSAGARPTTPSAAATC